MSLLMDLIKLQLTPSIIGILIIALGIVIIWQGFFRFAVIKPNFWLISKRIGIALILLGLFVMFGISIFLNILESTTLIIISAMILFAVVIIIYLLLPKDKKSKKSTRKK